MSDALKALRESAEANKDSYLFDLVRPEILETFKNPAEGKRMSVEIAAPEFTCLCPITGQPDYGCIEVTYQPHQKCVESKSFKLYLMGFRNEGSFHEAVVARIFSDLAALLSPVSLRVRGRFKPRGGVSFTPVVEL